MSVTAEALADALGGRREGRQWRCLCPVHGGHSLMVRDADGRAVVHCFAGCEFRDVAKALEGMGLWPKRDKPAGTPPKKVEWAKWFVRIYEADAAAQRTLTEQDLRDYRKAQAVLREAEEVARG